MKDEATPWDCPGFALSPVASNIGPFPHRPFIEALWRQRQPSDLPLPVQSDHAFVPLQLSRREERPDMVGFVGHADLVDYRSPLGDPAGVVSTVAAALEELAPGTEVVFDSLPEEAAAPLAKALTEVGMEAVPREHTVAAVLDLPDDFDEWLGGIGKKQRHELRRKVRRFEAALGPATIERNQGRGPWFDAFVDLHRSAPGAKGGFLDDAMTGFFGEVADLGFQVDLLSASERPVAAAFAFEDDEAYYLYNSAYNPDDAAASPGVMLLWSLIHRAIGEGKAVFDFLKGDEAYKFRLGAEPRPLYELRSSR